MSPMGHIRSTLRSSQQAAAHPSSAVIAVRWHMPVEMTHDPSMRPSHDLTHSQQQRRAFKERLRSQGSMTQATSEWQR